MLPSVVGRGIDIATLSAKIKSSIEKLRLYKVDADSFHNIYYTSSVSLAENIGVRPPIPYRIGRQFHHENMPAETPEEFYDRIITIPTLGTLYGSGLPKPAVWK